MVVGIPITDAGMTMEEIKMPEISKALGEDVEKAKATILAKEKAVEKVVIKITTRTIARITMIGGVIGKETKINLKTPKGKALTRHPPGGVGTPGM